MSHARKVLISASASSAVVHRWRRLETRAYCVFVKAFACVALAALVTAARAQAPAEGPAVPVDVTQPLPGEAPGTPTLTLGNQQPDEEAAVSAAPVPPLVEPPPPADKGPQQPEWVAEIDRVFGNALVKPLGSLLFYDFGTKERFGTGIPLIVLWLLFGATFCTLRMGFINIRGFWHAIRLTKGDYDDPNEAGEVSHFQALSSALSATVGLGNIAGVAIAVIKGGPGAVFWLAVAGLLGMSSKFSECTLAMLHRKIGVDGVVSGGPMHYLRDGLAELGLRPLGALLATLFAVMCIGGSFGGGNAFQVAQSLGVLKTQIPYLADNPWQYGLLMTVMTALVILGGIRRIASVADKIVPLMCGLYVVSSLWILGVNYEHVPGALREIWNGAMTPAAAYGGFLGVMVIGIQRASFSNEAGVGSAPIAHSAAKTDRPVSEGIVALLEPFIDTVVVCSMTGLVIVVSGVLHDPANQEFIENTNGAALTAAAFGNAWWGFKWSLCLTVFLFAYSTIISWSYYGERCWSHLFGQRTNMVYKLLFLAFVFLGSIVTATNVLDFSDLMILAMSIPNLFGVMLLSGKIKRALDEYWEDYKTGRIAPRRR